MAPFHIRPRRCLMWSLSKGVSATIHRNRAVRLSRGTFSSRRISLALFSIVGELPGWPVSNAANRAE
jgi:hypothetical protein